MHSKIVLLFLAFVLAGCVGTDSGNSAQASAQAPSASDFEVKWYDAVQFRAAYPASWTAQEGEGYTLFQSPVESESDEIRENINVVVAPMPAESTLQSYVEAALQPSVEGGAKVIGAGDLTFSGVPAKKVVYSEQSEGMELQYLQVFAAKDGMIYIVTYTATVQTFGKFLAEVENAARLFEIKSSRQNASPTPLASSSTAPELVRKWRVYSQSIFYDEGGSNFLETPASTLLELKADQTWSFGSSSGAWSVQAISEGDWAKWGMPSYGPTRKLVLNGWNGDVGDGPIDETESRADFMWVIYRVGPPAVEKPAQIQMKFGQTYP
ncbi:MAG TPA: PsbP-related protein [Candidatus Norongarragalinales archaeon]|nr:PsbP-related protein [Candidatus Norongarragalinales archaeon]